MTRGSSCLCLFARAPEVGRVKTRLAPMLGAERACRLHESLLEHCLSHTASAAVDRQLWTTDTGQPFIQACAATHNLQLFEQQGDDLGARMAHAIDINLAHYDEVIIIGSDCPGLDAEVISAAIAALRHGNDVVLAPADDGGYVLIGMNRLVDGVFENIDWGTALVMQQTRQRLEAAGVRWQELASHRDIDRPADIPYLLENYASIGVSVALPQSDHEPG